MREWKREKKHSTASLPVHNVFLVNDKPRKAIADIPKQGIKWGQAWHRVRVERNIDTGDIKLFFDGKLIHHTKDKHFTSGMIGFGSFDDTGMVDNIRIWAPKVEKTEGKMFGKERCVLTRAAADLEDARRLREFFSQNLQDRGFVALAGFGIWLLVRCFVQSTSLCCGGFSLP